MEGYRLQQSLGSFLSTLDAVPYDWIIFNSKEKVNTNHKRRVFRLGGCRQLHQAALSVLFGKKQKTIPLKALCEFEKDI